jgi:hypothetical protein
MDGSVDPGFQLAGLLVGQQGPNLLVESSFLGNAIIQPPPFGPGIALSFAAMMSIQYLTIDCYQQTVGGRGAQDCIMLGQGARLSMYAHNRLIQNAAGFNGFSQNGVTLGGCSTLDIFAKDWDSPINNGGHLHWQGMFQDGIQTDQCANVEVNCNAQHGLIAFWFEAHPVRFRPYWQVAFADPAAGVMVMSGGDMHGTADRYKYRIKKGATLDVNLPGEPGVMSTWPGAADTAWPVQGWLI